MRTFKERCENTSITTYVREILYISKIKKVK
jgi:hypothetical protein